MKMENKQKQEIKEKEAKLISLSDIFSGSLSSQEPRFYQTDSLHELLCHRYSVSRHTSKQKLIDLVTDELSI